MIGVPFDEGESQVNTTSPFKTVLVGAIGVAGTVAHNIEIGSLYSL